MAGFDDDPNNPSTLKGPDFLPPDGRKGLQNEESAVQNPYSYPEEPGEGPKGNGKRKRWPAWIRGTVFGGGGSVLLIGAIFSGSSSLKIPGILSMSGETGFSRLEHYVLRRAEKMVLQSVMTSKGVSGRSAVSSRSMVGVIAKTMTANKYEERLAARGIEFIKDGDGIRLKIANPDTATSQKIASKLFTTADEMEEALNGVPLTERMLNTVVSEDLGVWKFMVRGNIGKWMRKYLGLGKYGADKPTSTDQEKNIATEAKKDVTDTMNQKAKGVEELTNITEDTKSSGGDNVTSNASQASNTAAKEALSEVADDAAKEIGDKASSSVVMKIVGKLSVNLAKNITEKLAKAGISKAVPYYGLVVLSAQINVLEHWMGKNLLNGNAFRAIGAVGGSAMAYQYAKWQGLASQNKLGELDPSLLNYYAPLLDGVEESAAYNCIQKNWEKGCLSVGDAGYKLNETAPTWIRDIISSFNKMGLSGNDLAVLSSLDPSYPAAQAIVGIDKFLGDLIIGNIFKLVESMVPASIKSTVAEVLGKMTSGLFDAMLKMAGLDIDPLGGGKKLFSILTNGSLFSANRYMESLNMGQVDLAVVNTQTQEAIAERNQSIRDKGILYALFSPDVTNSITSQIAYRTPYAADPVSGASSVLGTLAGLVKSAPSGLASIVSTSVQAASPSSPEAELDAVPFGLTDAQLGSKIDDAMFTADGSKSSEEVCGTTSNTASNFFDILSPTKDAHSMCQFDYAVAKSVQCSMDLPTGESAECNPDVEANTSTTTTGTSGSSTIPVIGATAWPVSAQDWPGDVFDCDFRYQGEGGTIHTGIDISVRNVAVYAAVDGVISLPGAGMIDIAFRDANGKVMYFNYQHLSARVSDKGVPWTGGETVKAGAYIGISGSVATSSPHLHLSLWDVPVVSGHTLPTSTKGADALSHMWHPLSILPAGGRPAATCGPAPYHVPGGH